MIPGQVLGGHHSVLDRFKVQINWVSESISNNFDRRAERDDVKQEASIKVLNYAEVVFDGWGAGKLYLWETVARGDEERVKALLATQLRKDLNQVYARQLDKEIIAMSVDEIPASEEASCDEFQDRVIDWMERGERSLRKRYPTLADHYLDGYSEEEIARHDGVTTRAIRYRITKERAELAAAHETAATNDSPSRGGPGRPRTRSPRAARGRARPA
jgi:DNA-directed RNA polymerase specialized sigma24 family protein